MCALPTAYQAMPPLQTRTARKLIVCSNPRQLLRLIEPRQIGPERSAYDTN